MSPETSGDEMSSIRDPVRVRVGDRPERVFSAPQYRLEPPVHEMERQLLVPHFDDRNGVRHRRVFEHGIERAGARRQRTIEIGHLDGVPAPRAVLAGSKQFYVFSVFEEKPSLHFVDDDLFHSMYNLPNVFYWGCPRVQLRM